MCLPTSQVPLCGDVTVLLLQIALIFGLLIEPVGHILGTVAQLESLVSQLRELNDILLDLCFLVIGEQNNLL